MYTLYIITGVGGSGKTTLGRNAAKSLGAKLFSVDDYKVRYYHKYGFRSEAERLFVRKLAVMEFCEEAYNYCSKGCDIIVEYPFTSEWQEFFNLIKDRYGYSLVVVNCNTVDFDTIWRRRIARRDARTRGISLMSECYIDDYNYVLNELKVTSEYKALKDQEYVSGKYTGLVGDKVYTDEEFKTLLASG